MLMGFPIIFLGGSTFNSMKSSKPLPSEKNTACFFCWRLDKTSWPSFVGLKQQRQWECGNRVYEFATRWAPSLSDRKWRSEIPVNGPKLGPSFFWKCWKKHVCRWPFFFPGGEDPNCLLFTMRTSKICLTDPCFSSQKKLAMSIFLASWQT